MQKLTLPYKYQEILAGYKISAYSDYWGYAHYGWDMWSYDNPTVAERGKIYASGTGKVVTVGLDSGVGNVVVVRYDAAQLADGRVMPLVARYFHLARATCFVGQAVTAETLIGIEGNTGTSGTHLHIEFDRDTQWPSYSPQVKGGSIIRKGTDSTVNPALVFWARQGDVVLPSRYGTAWNTTADTNLARLPSDDVMQDKIDELTGDLMAERAKNAGLEMKIEKIRQFVNQTVG